MAEPIPSPDQKEVMRLQNRIIDEVLFALGMSRNRFGPEIYSDPRSSGRRIILQPSVAKFQAMVP